MTVKQIEKKMEQEMAKYETARKIREMLDALKKTLGDSYDEDEMNELVFGDE